MTIKIVFESGKVIRGGKDFASAMTKVNRLKEMGYKCKLQIKHVDNR